jgi:LysR family transcriptional regulator for bpeEF and oprC
MDRFQALLAFTRVVELGGFTRAAESLQIPKTTLSNLVQQLEAHLGVQLLQRTTRRVSVTADGTAFYERCTRVLADLAEAEAALTRAHLAPRGRLRIDVQGSLGKLVLVPALPDFFARYPDLHLDLGMGDRPVNLVEEGIDCVLRVGPQRDSAMVARRVGTMRFICCASPDYLARHGRPRTPEDLRDHRCVNYHSSRSGRALPFDFVRQGEKREIEVEGPVTVNDADAYLACGLNGLGIVQMATYLAQPHLESGRLEQVLADWTSEPFPISVMYPQNRHLSAKVRVFVDWIAELFEHHPLLRRG